MKSVIIAGVLTTLVAAIPPPVDLNQPDAGLPVGSPIANATTQVAASRDCYTPCRNHCIRMWAYENAAVDASDYDDDDGNKETILHFASMLQANGTEGVDMEKLKEALDMEMVD